MLMLTYSAALVLGLALGSPWWLARVLTGERYREGLGERLGRVPRRLRAFLAAASAGGGAGQHIVWVHAVSVGEVLAVSRLVSELEATGEPGIAVRVVLSTTTRTGQVLARERFGAERVFYFPLDFGWAVRAWLGALRPSLVVLAESEIWPRLLHECARAGVPVAVVNARMSDRSFRRAWTFRRVWGRVLQGVNLWLAQSQADADRLLSLGVYPDLMRVSGNLKYDTRAPRESRIASTLREMSQSRPVIVAGSTTDDKRGDKGEWEETQVICAWEGAARQQYGALLVLAPRHPERFPLIESALLEFAYAKASDWRSRTAAEQPAFADNEAEPAPTEHGLRLPKGSGDFVPGHRGRLDMVLLDTIGDLAAVYGIADVAFVGGSLVDRGGHNPLEPAQFGVPVVMGPHFENFREIVSTMQASDAIRVLQDVSELEALFANLLSDREAARALGERGQQVFRKQQGATTRTVLALRELLTRKAVNRPSSKGSA